MRVRVSLPSEDVEFLDAHISRRGGGSWSSVLQEALSLLRDSDLEDDYLHAWDDSAPTRAAASMRAGAESSLPGVRVTDLRVAEARAGARAAEARAAEARAVEARIADPRAADPRAVSM